MTKIGHAGRDSFGNVFVMGHISVAIFALDITEIRKSTTVAWVGRTRLGFVNFELPLVQFF